MSIEDALQSSDLEDVYDALIDIGKQGRADLAARAVPYLGHEKEFLREAAIKTLAFHLKLPAHKADAGRLMIDDPDDGVRTAAAMGLGSFAAKDPAAMQSLLAVALNTDEDEGVRHAAFLAALAAANVAAGQMPMARWLPGFETKADWGLLARTLEAYGTALPDALVARTRTLH